MTIKIENLSHSFGKIAALKDITTSVNPKSITALIGPNAAGKSTLLRFLSLAGISKAVQSRYKAKPDNRLPILIILRRYGRSGRHG